jgi:hypothetical protein
MDQNDSFSAQSDTPMDNAIPAMALKRVILYRKNSMFHETCADAEVEQSARTLTHKVF